MMRVTLISAGILGLLILALGVRVVAYRYRNRISLGTGNDGELEKLIRSHGNAVEWAPIGILLLFLAEQVHGATWYVIAAAAALVVGRLLHPLGLRVLSPNFFRSAGVVLTFLAIFCLAVLTVLSAFPVCEACAAAG